jgi:hypothetical protein
MPQCAKERYNRLNVAFPILQHFSKHYAAGGLAAEQAVGVLALLLDHEPFAALLLSAYQDGKVHSISRLLDDLLIPRQLGPYESAAIIEEARSTMSPVFVLDNGRCGFAYEDDERVRVEIRPTNPLAPRCCAWVIECHERNENHFALHEVGECLRRVLEGDLLSIGSSKFQFT